MSRPTLEPAYERASEPAKNPIVEFRELTVSRVSNGFIVRPASGQPGAAASLDTIVVCNTNSELAQIMSEWAFESTHPPVL